MASEESIARFAGIESPNYTEFPNVYLDALMGTLSPPEWMVLSYITRRTLGFGRHSDTISIAQISRGIQRLDGTRLDGGTGLSRPTVIKALRVLVERNIVAEEHRTSTEHGHEATRYTLVFAGGDPRAVALAPDVDGPVKEIDQPRQNGLPPLVKEIDLQKKGEQNKDDKRGASATRRRNADDGPHDYTGGRYGHLVET